MTETLQDALVALVQMLQRDHDIVLAQLPDVLRQYILLGRVYFVLALTTSLVIPVVAARLFVRWSRKYSEIVEEKGPAYQRDEEIKYAIGKVCVVVGGCGVTFGSVLAALHYLTAIIAPKWYVVELFLK